MSAPPTSAPAIASNGLMSTLTRLPGTEVSNRGFTRACRTALVRVLSCPAVNETDTQLSNVTLMWPGALNVVSGTIEMPEEVDG